jgi:hypothetical protein
VQCRVSRIHVMVNRSEEIRVGVLSARSNTNRTSCEIGHFVKPTRCLKVIMRSDRTEEGKQRLVVGLIDLPIGSGHPHTLPDAAGSTKACRVQADTRKPRRPFWSAPERRD